MGRVQFNRENAVDAAFERNAANDASLKNDVTDTVSFASESRELRSETPRVQDSRGQESCTDRSLQAIVADRMAMWFLRNVGEGSLVLWIGLFAARLVFDASWRELVSVAPLAAISKMIIGIQ